MYNQFFGLHQAPFSLTPDPDFLYLTGQHKEALAGLTYAIIARKGFTIMTGNAGTGKTTILRRALEFLRDRDIHSSLIVHPTLSTSEFLEAALLDFGFKRLPASKAQRISMLRDFLLKAHREGKTAVLIVDEAHRLSPEVLEEIRLLGNFESASEKLLQIVLVGQSELDSVLNGENLVQFKQRVSQRLAIEPLSGPEVEQYIEYRWTKAGGHEAPFSTATIASISQVSRGVPRVINVLCDNALMHAFAEESRSVEARHVLAVCRDLQLPLPLPKGAEMETPVARKDSFGIVIRVRLPKNKAVKETSALATDSVPMKTLARYSTVAPKPPLLERLLGKFGFRPRIETA